jgi:hypothetical protein
VQLLQLATCNQEKHMAKATDDQIKREWEMGRTDGEAAANLGMSRQAYQKRRKKLGLRTASTALAPTKPEPGERRITPKQQRFINAYLQTADATQAAKDAGYNCNNHARFRERGAELLAVPKIAAEIERLLVEPVHVGFAAQYVPEWAMPMEDASLLALFNWFSVRW